MVSREQNGNKAGVHSESLIKFRHTFPVDMSIPVKHTVYGLGPFRIDTGDRLLSLYGPDGSLSPLAIRPPVRRSPFDCGPAACRPLFQPRALLCSRYDRGPAHQSI